MATLTAKLYGQAVAKAFNKEIDWDSDPIYAIALTSAYAPDQDAHVYQSHLTGEVVGAGYTAGGKLLTGRILGYDPVTNTVKLDADDLSWPGATMTVHYIAIVDRATGVAATSPLIAYIDLGQDVSAAGGQFASIWDAAGIANISVA